MSHPINTAIEEQLWEDHIKDCECICAYTREPGRGLDIHDCESCTQEVEDNFNNLPEQ